MKTSGCATAPKVFKEECHFCLFPLILSVTRSRLADRIAAQQACALRLGRVAEW